MVLRKHVDGEYTIFSTMEGPLAKNPLGKFIGVVSRGTYQAACKYSRLEYEPVYDLWTDI